MRRYTFADLAVLERRCLDAMQRHSAYERRRDILFAWERWMCRVTGGRFGRTAIFLSL